MRAQPHEARRAAGLETRRRILAVALELFSAEGYAGTSIRDIAESMGTTTAALYYHFESKEQILEAVTEPIRAEMARLHHEVTASPPPTPEELLTSLVDMLSRHAALIQTVFNDPSVHRGQREAAKDMFQALAGILGGSGPDGMLRARCAVGAVQLGVLGTVRDDPRFGMPLPVDRALRLLDGEDHALDAEVRRRVVEAALRALGGPGPS